MKKLSFREIVACTGGTTSYCGDDFFLSSIKFDSRGEIKDAAFIAFITEKDNGHHYISMAEKKGALAAIVSEETNTSLPTIMVEDTKKAYQEIALYYRNKFTCPIIAITGSNGKTTVKDMLTAILSTRFKVLSTEKNYNNELGVPQTLLMLDDTYDIVVLEMGMNHSGEIHTLSMIAKPEIGIITNIGLAHIGNLKDNKKTIFDAKMELTDGMKKQGTLILYHNDPMLCNVTKEDIHIIFCGLTETEHNELYATNISQYWEKDHYGLTFLLHYNKESYHCHLPILGKHNVGNALLALTASIKAGIPLEQGITALQNYPRSPMRLETVKLHGIYFIKDYYNASIDSTKAALDTLSEIKCSGKKIAILGEVKELGKQSETLHSKLASYTVGKADLVYYLGNYQEAFLSGRKDSYCFSTKEELNLALSYAITKKELQTGDIVLMKGSHENKLWEQYDFIYNLLEHGSTIPSQTQLLIDVAALKHNYTAIKHYVGNDVEIMPVVKADAYGSGARLLATIYPDCSFFAVADLREAEELHPLMPNARFLVLYEPFEQDIAWLIEHDYIVVSASRISFLQKLNAAAKKARKKQAVHIEIDTGMGRLGAFLKECHTLAETLLECNDLIVEGIFTHYSSADMYEPADLEFTAMQTEKFKKAIKIVEDIIGEIPYKHACAGAAIFNPKAELFNLVRPGYILRGYYPCKEIKEKIDLKPALKYIARIAQIREFEPGESISYGRHFITKRKTRLAEVPVGYSDGLMRKLSNRGAFVINGQLAPIVGNITMDYTMVDITDITGSVQIGDEAAIFDNINMTVEHMAELCDTIGYEILTNIKNKADRIEIF